MATRRSKLVLKPNLVRRSSSDTRNVPVPTSSVATEKGDSSQTFNTDTEVIVQTETAASSPSSSVKICSPQKQKSTAAEIPSTSQAIHSIRCPEIKESTDVQKASGARRSRLSIKPNLNRKPVVETTESKISPVRKKCKPNASPDMKVDERDSSSKVEKTSSLEHSINNTTLCSDSSVQGSEANTNYKDEIFKSSRTILQSNSPSNHHKPNDSEDCTFSTAAKSTPPVDLETASSTDSFDKPRDAVKPPVRRRSKLNVNPILNTRTRVSSTEAVKSPQLEQPVKDTSELKMGSVTVNKSASEKNNCSFEDTANRWSNATVKSDSTGNSHLFQRDTEKSLSPPPGESEISFESVNAEDNNYNENKSSVRRRSRLRVNPNISSRRASSTTTLPDSSAETSISEKKSPLKDSGSDIQVIVEKQKSPGKNTISRNLNALQNDAEEWRPHTSPTYKSPAVSSETDESNKTMIDRVDKPCDGQPTFPRRSRMNIHPKPCPQVSGSAPDDIQSDPQSHDKKSSAMNVETYDASMGKGDDANDNKPIMRRRSKINVNPILGKRKKSLSSESSVHEPTDETYVKNNCSIKNDNVSSLDSIEQKQRISDQNKSPKQSKALVSPQSTHSSLSVSRNSIISSDAKSKSPDKAATASVYHNQGTPRDASYVKEDNKSIQLRRSKFNVKPNLGVKSQSINSAPSDSCSQNNNTDQIDSENSQVIEDSQKIVVPSHSEEISLMTYEQMPVLRRSRLSLKPNITSKRNSFSGVDTKTLLQGDRKSPQSSDEELVQMQLSPVNSTQTHKKAADEEVGKNVGSKKTEARRSKIHVKPNVKSCIKSESSKTQVDEKKQSLTERHKSRSPAKYKSDGSESADSKYRKLSSSPETSEPCQNLTMMFTALQKNNVADETAVHIASVEKSKEAGVNDEFTSARNPFKPGGRTRLPKAKPNIANLPRVTNRGSSVVANPPLKESSESMDISASPLPLSSEGRRPADSSKSKTSSSVIETCTSSTDHEKKKSKPSGIDSVVCDAPEKDEHDKSSGEKKGAKRKRYRVTAPTDQPPDRFKMTMKDLIYWNPSTSPMKNESFKKKAKFDYTPESDSLVKKPENSGGDASFQVPQIKIGPDGNIILDEKSVIINTPKKSNLSPTIVEETEPFANYGSFRKIKNRKMWTDRETKKFFAALSIFGTDFSLMSALFPKRNRQELKNKFKREERCNKFLVDKAISDRQSFDSSMFEEGYSDEEEDEKKNKDDESVPKKSRRKSKKSKKKSAEDIENNPENNDESCDVNKKIRRTARCRVKKKIFDPSEDKKLDRKNISDKCSEQPIKHSPRTNDHQPKAENDDDGDMYNDLDDDSQDDEAGNEVARSIQSLIKALGGSGEEDCNQDDQFHGESHMNSVSLPVVHSTGIDSSRSVALSSPFPGIQQHSETRYKSCVGDSPNGLERSIPSDRAKKKKCLTRIKNVLSPCTKQKITYFESRDDDIDHYKSLQVQQSPFKPPTSKVRTSEMHETVCVDAAGTPVTMAQLEEGNIVETPVGGISKQIEGATCTRSVTEVDELNSSGTFYSPVDISDVDNETKKRLIPSHTMTVDNGVYVVYMLGPEDKESDKSDGSESVGKTTQRIPRTISEQVSNFEVKEHVSSAKDGSDHSKDSVS